MKIKEAIEVLDGDIMISYCNNLLHFDRRSPLMMSAYGDFKVAKIEACLERSTSDSIVYELAVAVVPIKE